MLSHDFYDAFLTHAYRQLSMQLISFINFKISLTPAKGGEGWGRVGEKWGEHCDTPSSYPVGSA